MLLAAIVAAFLVVANQVVDTWTEGHLLAAWIVLWMVAFAALAPAGPSGQARGRRPAHRLQALGRCPQAGRRRTANCGTWR